MPTALTHPGVYVEELPGGARPIAGVSTSVTAFVGFFTKGPTDRPTMVSSFAEFEREYGGLDSRSAASYGVSQFFMNGGRRAVLVRASGTNIAVASDTIVSGANDILTVNAANPGDWGEEVQVGVEHVGTSQFNLVVRRVREVDGQDRVVATEVHLNLSMQEDDRRYVETQVNDASQLVTVVDEGHQAGQPGRERPPQTGTGLDLPANLNDVADTSYTALTGGDDGNLPTGTQLSNAFPLLDLLAPQIFNMMCIPSMADLTGAAYGTLVGAANQFCRERRAFLFVDPNVTADTMAAFNTWHGANATAGERNNAIYFPRLEIADPLADNAPRTIPPSGTMAGIYARTDTERGVWKAPAGTEATIRGANIAGSPLTEADSGALNPLGINALRSLPVFGNVVWGARTGEGANQRASEWKYVPVRRTALYIEESLYQGLQWVVFEPNDEKLWGQIRVSVGGFMQTLFRKGAFQGTNPRDAYLVRCDSTTTTQADIDNGVVNILVGFAPLKPAEFVVIQIQQLTAQAAA